MAKCEICGTKIGGITGKVKPFDETLEKANKYGISLPAEVCNECASIKISQHEYDLELQKKAEKEQRLKAIESIFASATSMPPDYEDLGIVAGYCILGTGPISTIASSWTDFFGAESISYLEKVDKAETFAMLRAKEKAYKLGATAIYNTHINLTEASQGHGMLMLSVWGSAAKKGQ